MRATELRDGTGPRALAALIMAAGEGRRFGGCKPLAAVHGTSLLQRMIDQARPLLGDIFVVTGAWHSFIAQAQRNGELADVPLIHNVGWQRGLGHSIATGVTHLANDFDGILVLLADQVAITSREIETLVGRFTGDNIACGLYAGQRGAPAIFGRNSFARLQSLADDRGAKQLLYASDIRISECSMPQAAFDIDTRQELENWLQTAGAFAGGSA